MAAWLADNLAAPLAEAKAALKAAWLAAWLAASWAVLSVHWWVATMAEQSVVTKAAS